MLNFANSILGYKNWYCFISIKFDIEKKWIICRNFVAGVTKFLRVILIFLVSFKIGGIKYLWKGEISKVLVPIEVMPVNNDYFFSSKIRIAEIPVNEWVSVLAQFLLQNIWSHILVTSSLFVLFLFPFFFFFYNIIDYNWTRQEINEK